MSNRVYVSASPHVSGDLSSQRIMRDVILSLLPVLAISTLFFGLDALYVSGVAVAASLLFEYLIRRFMMGEKGLGGDMSPVVTGLLL